MTLPEQGQPLHELAPNLAAAFAAARREVARWEPRPCPPPAVTPAAGLGGIPCLDQIERHRGWLR